MTPPRRSLGTKITSAAESTQENTTPRRSPRLQNLTNVSKPYRSPLIQAASIQNLGNRLENTHILGQKRRSSQPITPLRKECNPTTGVTKDPRLPGTELSTSARSVPLREPGNTPRRAGRRSIVEAAPPPSIRPSVLLTEDGGCSTDSGISSQEPSFDWCGLPRQVADTYKEKRGIGQLYDWQRDCLSSPRLLAGDNAIVCLPTGAGKTLVAEVLMLREALVKGRSSLLVLPYVAIVQEKMTSLSVFEDAFGIHVEEYAASKGRLPPIKRRGGRRSIYVATIEKANMLVNAMLEAGTLGDIGLVVVDELHMIGEGERGACIESMLTKVLTQGPAQCIGISATLTNMDELARFMNAFVYSTDFRPVELTELVKVGQRLLRVSRASGTLLHHADLPNYALASRDPDGICQLLQPVIPRHSAIVFCPTKKNCENVAALVAKLVPKAIRDVRQEDRKALAAMIREEGDGKADDSLERCIESGIAWHHSGLTHDERKHIEAAYISGTLCVLCATSTLAAGVNLPARRVIIKSPMVGRERLRKSQYMQMIGRAGRAGFDERGEAITILRPGGEEQAFRTMLQHEEMRCESALGGEAALASFVLDVLSLKLASSFADLEGLVAKTLAAQQKGPEGISALLTSAVARLQTEELLAMDEEGALSVTEVGSATFGASIAPAEAGPLRRELLATLAGGVNFASHLHLLFIVAPYDIACAVDWDLFYQEFQRLPESEKRLLEASGVSMQRIMLQISRRTPLVAGEAAMRLYIALMMMHVWKQVPHTAVALRFSVDRGWLQSALQSIVAHAGAITRFAERLPSSLWPLRLLLPELVSRLAECSRPELTPLLALDLVKRNRAAQLYAIGLKTVADVAAANPDAMVSSIESLGRYQARKIVQSARALLRDQIDEKLEEMEAIGIAGDALDMIRAGF